MYYPGLEPTRPRCRTAADARLRRDRLFIVESEEEAIDLFGRTKLFQLAEPLGGVESLIEHPARMTHASTADEPFAPPPNLIRLSAASRRATTCSPISRPHSSGGQPRPAPSRFHTGRQTTPCLR